MRFIIPLIALFLITSMAFASGINSIDLSTTAQKSVTAFSATINATNTGDAQAFCLSIADNNASAKCIPWASFSSPLALSYSVINGIESNTPSDGSYQLYAYIQLTDGNFTTPKSPGSTMIIDNTGPTIALSPANGAAFNTTSVVVDINLTDFMQTWMSSTIAVKIDGITSPANLSGTTLQNAHFELSGLSAGDHTIVVDANDILQNHSQATATFTIDQTAPSDGSLSFSGWTNSTKPTLTVSATHHSGPTGLQMRFSCNNSSWATWVPYQTSYSDFNVNATSYGCQPTDWNKRVYVQFRDAAGNVGSTSYSTYVLYDTVPPSEPTALSATAASNSASLTWTAPEADNNSGNKSYKIYMKVNTGSYSEKTTSTTTSKSISGLTNGAQHCFKVTTIDNAGNESDYSSEACATPTSTTASIQVEKDGSDVEYAKANDVLQITCEYTSEVDSAKLYYKYFNPNGSNTALEEDDDTEELTSDFTIPRTATAEKIGFWCTASGVSNSSTEYVYIDNTAPTASWQDSNNQFIGVKKVSISVSDNKLVDSVEFEFNRRTYGASKDSSLKYYMDLNTLAFENGEYDLKAIIYDAAGNKTELTRKVTVENVLGTQQKAKKAVSDANAQKIAAEGLIAYYTQEGLALPLTLKAKKESADALLLGATQDTNYIAAYEKAQNALTLYEQFNSAAKIETKDTQKYIYDANTLVSILQKAGLTESSAITHAALINAMKIERSIYLVKAGSTDNLQIKVTLTITNDTNNSTVKVVEVIPKELIASAATIVSDANFRVVKNDPIIEFTLTIAPGAKAVINYGTGEMLSQQATQIMQKNIASSFGMPPLVLTATERAEEVVNTGFSINTEWIILIIGIVVIIALISAAVYVMKARAPSHGFGETRHGFSKGNIKTSADAPKKKWGTK